MKNLGYIAGEITKGKNLSENLLKYGNGMCSMYNGLGFIKMSMNYYTVLDIARDLQNDKDLLNMITPAPRKAPTATSMAPTSATATTRAGTPITWRPW